jgi:hypothetical protein
MVRLYDVTAGSIMLNGMDVRCVRKPDALATHLSSVHVWFVLSCSNGQECCKPIDTQASCVCRELRQGSLRGSVAVVPQDTVLFNDTIYRNIAYGRCVTSAQLHLHLAVETCTVCICAVST